MLHLAAILEILKIALLVMFFMLLSVAIINNITKLVKKYLYKRNNNPKIEILQVIAKWLYLIEDRSNQLMYDKKMTEKYRGIIKKEYNKLLKNSFLLNSTNHDLMLSIVYDYRYSATILYFSSIVSDDYDKLDKWYKYGGQNKIISRFEYRKEKNIMFDRFCIEKEKIVAYLK